ncbi:MAG: hypothetical protein HQ553_04290 [Chloroflexi bacterium]|nr:hypothetical protein [Chloroflexota bacterium]
MEWSNTFGEHRNDVATCIQRTTDNGYIFVGHTESYRPGVTDVSLFKLDENGIEQWSKPITGSGEEIAYSVRQTSDGGYIIAGSVAILENDNYLSRPWLIKTDSDGTEQWSKVFVDDVGGVAYSIEQTSDNGYIACGVGDIWDFWLVKVNVDGEEQWIRTFGGSEGDKAYAVQQTGDGGYIIAGETESNTTGRHDAWLIKTNEAGIEEWSRKIGGTWEETAYALDQTLDGGYIIAGEKGTISGPIGWNWDVWIAKLDENGIEEWTKTYGSSNKIDRANSVIQTLDGGYMVAGIKGENYDFQETKGDAWLIKIGEDGSLEWDQTFGGDVWDTANCIEQTPDGGYIVAGTNMNSDLVDTDFWVFKLTSTSGDKQHESFSETPASSDIATTTSVDEQPVREIYVRPTRYLTKDKQALHVSLLVLWQVADEKQYRKAGTHNVGLTSIIVKELRSIISTKSMNDIVTQSSVIEPALVGNVAQKERLDEWGVSVSDISFDIVEVGASADWDLDATLEQFLKASAAQEIEVAWSLVSNQSTAFTVKEELQAFLDVQHLSPLFQSCLFAHTKKTVIDYSGELRVAQVEGNLIYDPSPDSPRGSFSADFIKEPDGWKVLSLEIVNPFL